MDLPRSRHRGVWREIDEVSGLAAQRRDRGLPRIPSRPYRSDRTVRRAHNPPEWCVQPRQSTRSEPIAAPFLDWWADRAQARLPDREPGRHVRRSPVDRSRAEKLDAARAPRPRLERRVLEPPGRKLARSGSGYRVERTAAALLPLQRIRPADLSSTTWARRPASGSPSTRSSRSSVSDTRMSSSRAVTGRGPGSLHHSRHPPRRCRSTRGRAGSIATLLVHAERGHGKTPPNPFAEGAAFERWLNEHVGPHEVTRYLRAFYNERPDVRAAFPDINGNDARLFVDWIRSEAATPERIDQRLVPRPPHPTRVNGVNVAGYFAAENGVGEAARLFLKAFEAVDVPSTVVPYRNTRSRQDIPVNDHDTRHIHDVNVLYSSTPINCPPFSPTLPSCVPKAGIGSVSGRGKWTCCPNGWRRRRCTSMRSGRTANTQPLRSARRRPGPCSRSHRRSQSRAVTASRAKSWVSRPRVSCSCTVRPRQRVRAKEPDRRVEASGELFRRRAALIC